MAREIRRYFVSGRVQGVGYRYWAVGRARLHGLTGWVRNRADGRVEILAGAPGPQLDAFQRDLWDGPAGAKVQAVEQGAVGDIDRQALSKLKAFEQISTAP